MAMYVYGKRAICAFCACSLVLRVNSKCSYGRIRPSSSRLQLALFTRRLFYKIYLFWHVDILAFGISAAFRLPIDQWQNPLCRMADRMAMLIIFWRISSLANAIRQNMQTLESGL